MIIKKRQLRGKKRICDEKLSVEKELEAADYNNDY